MGLADSARPQEEQPDVESRIFINEVLGVAQRFSLRLTVLTISISLWIVIVERAILVALRDARAGEQLGAAVADAAAARADTFALNQLPARAATIRTSGK